MTDETTIVRNTLVSLGEYTGETLLRAEALIDAARRSKNERAIKLALTLRETLQMMEGEAVWLIDDIDGRAAAAEGLPHISVYDSNHIARN